MSRETLKGLLKQSPLAGPAFHAREHLIAWRAGRVPAVGDDGLPLPPALLMVRVVGEADPVTFQEWGATSARLIRETAARHGLADPGSVLDFGCGCGRVARHWRDTPKLCGCDVYAPGVQWAARNLPFGRFSVSPLQPPLPYPDASFELIYALSVLTHVSEALGAAWLGELRRATQPGGLLYITMLGESFAEAQLPPRELAAYRAGDYVVCEANVEGSNLCCAYANTERFAATLASAGWEVLETRAGEPGMGGQDAYLARR